jgi:ABC-2 type transport system permease protein
MHELLSLGHARIQMLHSAALEFLHGSRLRAAVVLGLIAIFWLLMFGMFLDAFRFLRTFKPIGEIVLDYVFAFFYLSLLVMMTISNTIIAYTSLYRSEETTFLYTLPTRAENTFVYRGLDSMVFSSWGMATLVVPMVIAYGLTFAVPVWFYPMSLALAFLFTVLAAELGAALALVVALVLPRRRRPALAVSGIAVAAALVVWLLPLWLRRPTNLFSESGIKSIMDRIAFCQHWALPSRWVSHGMLSAAHDDPGTSTFLALMLLSNVLFLGLVTYRGAFYCYRHTWETIQGASAKRKYRPEGLLDASLRTALVFLPFRLRLLVLKDLKTFLRDPAQWSQFLLFFGLLALYIVNLPHFGVGELAAYWHSLIANLNLGTTCLTLATLTSRFVFPQLSLEGRRIWLTGLVPMRRTLILWGKFVFAALGTFVVSGALIVLSDLMIGLPAWVLGIHLLVVGCVCAGLNGLAVGLGALYPRMGTDNPSKIVSSFGGTLNLICSICFLVVAIVPVVVPLHVHMLGRLEGPHFILLLGLGVGAALASSAVACLVPMLAGARAFSRMEF